MNNIELSIQINLDGFSFLAKNDLGDIGSGSFTAYDFSVMDQLPGIVRRVKIYCSVSAAQVIPREVFDVNMSHNYLSGANMVGRGDVALWATADDSKYVVWALNGSLYEILRTRYPSAEWLHPLVEICGDGNRNVLNLILDNRVVHITLFDNQGLISAMSISYVNEDDILYYTHRISKGADIRVVVAGSVSGHFVGKLKQYYTSVEPYADPLFLNRL